MSKADDFDKNMAEIYLSIDEQSEFRDGFIDDLLEENYQLKCKIDRLEDHLKFLLRNGKKL